MGRRTLLAAFAAAAVGLAFQGAVPAAEPRIERKPEFVERVNAAIERGVKWLRGAQQAGGPYPDYGGYAGAMTALAYYTLRVSGVPRDDPAAVRAFDAMRQSYASTIRRGRVETYSAGLFCMALAEHGDPVASPSRDREPQSRLDETDAAWMKELVRTLESTQDANGRWSYGGPRGDGRNDYDHSNTQYALLGLKAASRAGAKVKTSTWLKSLKHFIAAQENDGRTLHRFEPGVKGRTSAKVTDRARGWGYMAEDPAYGSMTAGGVGSLVICRSELLGSQDYGPGLDAKAEQSARDGIAWLGVNFAVTTNPPFPAKVGMSGPSWHYYYLYALERAGVLASVEWMAEHDWYGEGAEYLLGAQLGSGAWRQSDGGFGRIDPRNDAVAVQSTCFALLFLKKGTLPVARGALTRDIDDSDINFAAALTLPEPDFEDFIDLVLSRWHRVGAEDAKDRIFARATAVGSRIVLPLIERLSSPKDDEREAAIALLRRATGFDLSFDPAASPERREDAIDRWQAWWLANEATLHYDAAAGKLSAGK